MVKTAALQCESSEFESSSCRFCQLIAIMQYFFENLKDNLNFLIVQRCWTFLSQNLSYEALKPSFRKLIDILEAVLKAKWILITLHIKNEIPSKESRNSQVLRTTTDLLKF